MAETSEIQDCQDNSGGEGTAAGIAQPFGRFVT